jgi:hypothetical protein
MPIFRANVLTYCTSGASFESSPGDFWRRTNAHCDWRQASNLKLFNSEAAKKWTLLTCEGTLTALLPGALKTVYIFLG